MAIKTASLRTLLQAIYQRSFDNAQLLSLLQFVAEQLRQLHEQRILLSGVNNQTLLITYQNAADWHTIAFAPECQQVHSPLPLSVQEIADNLAAVNLPDDYWRVFKYLYFSGNEPPKDFTVRADALRDENRKITTADMTEKNIWLWDDKSAQAMVVLHSKTKRRYRSKLAMLKLALRVLWAYPKIFFTYKKLLRTAYQHPVTLTDRIAVALHPAYWSHEKKLLHELHNIPVLIRFYCHEGETEWQKSVELIAELHQQQIKVMVALVQDRQAVLHHARWQNFLNKIVPQIHDKVVWIELGHAINRVKWGIWDSAEYANLCAAILMLTKQYPHLRLIGPAVIDFEWHRVLDALVALPKQLQFFGVSQHLYVDRRGAPENFQGRYSTLEKCAMGKAIAKASDNTDDRFIISEFNWPLKNTGIYSPIGSPYTAPEWFRDLPGVTESEYAQYLIRYLAITLCSGFTTQAVLWRLSAHGYGLVDDLDHFHKRPAFIALQHFLSVLGHSEFQARLTSSKDVYLLQFSVGQQQIILAWTTAEQQCVTLPWPVQCIENLFGEALPNLGKNVKLSTTPVYFFKEAA